MAIPEVAFLGAGNMAEALIRGLLRKTAKPQHILATARRAERQSFLRQTYSIDVSADNVSAVQKANLVVLSVKPQAMRGLLKSISPHVRPDQLFISVAAGVPLEAIQSELGPQARIIRSMPNTPALIGAGATALSLGAHAQESDLNLAKELFESVGICVVVEENLLDAVTGLSGSGPAYVFLMIEALCDAGVKVGLPRYTALKLATQTVMGSALLLQETGAHPGQLRDQVTSPGGTAIAGLHTLEAGGLRTTLMNAVEAATHRAKQLGEAFLLPERSASKATE